YGNSFGVITGDRKYPTWRSLVALKLHLVTLGNVANWGLTYLGVLGAVYLGLRRKFPAEILAALVGYAIYVLVAQRLTSHPTWSSHYHVVGIIPGVMLIAAAVNELTEQFPFLLRGRTLTFGLASIIVLLATSTFVQSLEYRRNLGESAK